MNSGAIKKALDEIQSQNEGIGNYFAEEEQRLLAEIAKQLNRLEYLQRRLREEKTSFERRREQEEKEIDRLGIVGYLKTYSGVKSFGYWRAYELLAEIVDPEGYHRLLTKGLSVKDIDIEELCKSERVVVIEPNSSRKERRVSREMLPNG